MSVLTETPAVIAVVLTATILVFTGWIVLNEINATGVFDSQSFEIFMDFLEGMDGLIVGFFILTSLIAIGFAYYIRTKPIFFAFTILVLMVSVLFAVIVKDVYVEIGNNEAYQPVSNIFPLTYQLFNNLPVLAIIFSFLIAIAMFAKPGGGGV